MKRLPSGKGMFIWKIKNAHGGDVQAIATAAQEMGLTWVAVKINRGYYSYNLRWDGHGWIDDYIALLKTALNAVGVELWGWGECWLLNGRAEAGKAVERVAQFGLQGYLIDAEGQAKRSPDRKRQAELYALEMSQANMPVGLCSYRFPQYHMELPWDELLAGCDFHAPQVYWIHGVDPGWQLTHSMEQLQLIKDLPFVPAGPAFDEHGWMPTVAELNEFHDTAVESECLGEIWWEWDEAHDNGFMPVIAAQVWGPPPPVPPTLEQRVAELELRCADLEARVSELES